MVKSAGNRNKASEMNEAVGLSTFPIPGLLRFRLTLILGIIAFLLYANTMSNGFALEDLTAITDNALVTKGISGIPSILTTPFHHGNAGSELKDDQYRPLSLTVFAIEYQFSANDPRPGHLVNVLLFACCVMVLFKWLCALFPTQPLTAVLAALLFALHPIHTEVVANIKSCDELLCFLFGMLALYSFAQYSSTALISRLIAGAAFLFVSLLAKETTITFVVLVPLVLVAAGKSSKKVIIQCAAATLLAATGYLIIRYSVLSAWHVNNTSAVSFYENPLVAAPSVNVRLATPIQVLGRYIVLLFVPWPLSCDYGFGAIPFSSFANPLVWLSAAIYGALAIFAIYRLMKKHRDPLTTSIIFFLVTIAVFSNIFILLGAEMAERFLFLPSAGFCLAIGYLASLLTGKAALPLQSALRNGRLLTVLVPVCFVFAGLTITRNNEWKDSFTLFTTDSKRFPANGRLHYLAGNEEAALVTAEGTEPDTKKVMLDDAIADLGQSLQGYPAFLQAHNALVNLYLIAGNMDSAEVHGRAALLLQPNDPIALNGMTNVYLGRRKFTAAIDLASRASHISPANAFYPGSAGIAYMFLKQYDSAIVYFKKSVELDPANHRSLKFLSMVYYATNQEDSAKKYEALVKVTDPAFNVAQAQIPQ